MFQIFFGDGGNDTMDDTHNETSRIANGTTLFAGGNIDWQ
jgi:hypothetical protein